MDNPLQGEVANFVSQLGFSKISNKDVDDDFDLGPDTEDLFENPKPTKSKKSKKVKSNKNIEDNLDLNNDREDTHGNLKPKKEKKGKIDPKLSPDIPAVRGVAKAKKKGATPADQLPTTGQAITKHAEKQSRRGRRREPAVQVAEVSSSGEQPPESATAVPDSELWYTTSVTDTDARSVTDSEAARLSQEAAAHLSQAVKLFKADGGGQAASQWNWTQTVLSSGTVSDKMAARATLLRARPELHLYLLEDTVRMVSAKGKSHAMTAMNTLDELFTKHLLPPGRKLKHFRQQPLGALPDVGESVARRKQLILWLFEERLKTLYGEFVGRVKDMAHDTLEKTRKHGVNTLAQLLTAHPELEQTLLESLVNKLGDEKKSVACLAVRRLSSLLRAHPAMRMIVVKEVERILFRQNVGKRVQFYGICFLSQVQFSDEGDEELAQRIVRIYVGFFKACVKQAELDARLMRALLTGLSGCVGRARLLAAQLQQYVQPLHHIAQLANFGVATQALLLMFRLTTAGGETEPTDRYYCALYRKLVHPGLATSQKLADFLNLVYRSVRMDQNVPRARAFVKRLLQCCLHQTAALACSVLLLISELFRRRPELAQVLGQQAAAVWTADDEGNSGDEAPRDAADTENNKSPPPEGDEPAPGEVPAGWSFVSVPRSGDRRRRYDPLYREPRWCRAELTALHELAPLARHLHPSLALFANQLVNGQSVTYAGNPLHDFQLMHFLNRFCYRNPKKTGGVSDEARRLAVSAPGYAKLQLSQVPHDERFFHRYFRWREEHGLTLAAPGKPLTDARGDVTDEAFDSFLDGFFEKKSKKKGADAVDFLTEMKEGAEEAEVDSDGGEDDQLGDDEEDDMGDDSSEDSDDPGFPMRSAGPTGSKRSSGEVSDLFASAEEFSELLEEGAEEADGTSQASAGRSSRKQLAWEESGSGKRPRQASSVDRRAGKRNQGGKGNKRRKR